MRSKSELTFCDSCVQGKSHWLPFQQLSVKSTSNPLELIHSEKLGYNHLAGVSILSLFY